jgi:hypothetical protein
MTEKSTLNHLVRFIYKETKLTENLAIEEDLDQNWDLREAYFELFDAFKELPKAVFKPSHGSINKIMKYSHNTALETQC